MFYNIAYRFEVIDKVLSEALLFITYHFTPYIVRGEVKL